MEKVKEIRDKVLSRGGRYPEVYPEGLTSKSPSLLKVKEVRVESHRYIVFLNGEEA